MNNNIKELKTKVCSKCNGVFLATSEYWHKDKYGKYGFHSKCKRCRNEKSKIYRINNQDSIAKKREANRERNNEYYRKYQLENKDKIKQKSDKYRKHNKHKIDKYRELNKEKIRERQRIWHSENKEYVNEQYRKYYRKNKSRIRNQKNLLYKENIEEMRRKGRMRTQKYLATKKGLENSLTKEQWESTLAYFDESCAYCGIERSDLIKKDGIDLNQEHFIPLSKGGGYTIDNIVPSCRSCNSSKGNKNFFDWYKKQNYYSLDRESRIKSYLGL